jgi:hypothetical protein
MHCFSPQLISKGKALTRKGWIHLSYDDLRNMGELDKAKQTQDLFASYWCWCLGTNGALAYVKDLSASPAVCEYLAMLLADKAGMPCPPIDIVPYQQPNRNFVYACVSSALGQKQQTLQKFLDNNPDPESLKQVCRDISYLLPFWKLIGPDDLHNENIIVASWSDEQENKNQCGVYGIDYSSLNFSSTVFAHRIWSLWAWENEFFSLDNSMYALGVKAVKSVTNDEIKNAVNRAFTCCSVNSIFANGYGPYECKLSSHEVTKWLCDNRDKLLHEKFDTFPEKSGETPPMSRRPDIPINNRNRCALV